MLPHPSPSPRLLTMIVMVVTMALLPFHAAGETGLIKTKDGFLAFVNNDSLFFTVHWEDEFGKIPEWAEYNRLSIFKDQFDLGFFEAQPILSDYPDISDPLLALQKWETDYIEETMPSHIQRSPFLRDTTPLQINTSAAHQVNRCYYSVETPKGDPICFYFIDIHQDGTFIRLSFIGLLKDVKRLTESMYSSLRFYPQEMDVELLQQAVRSGKYGH